MTEVFCAYLVQDVHHLRDYAGARDRDHVLAQAHRDFRDGLVEVLPCYLVFPQFGDVQRARALAYLRTPTRYVRTASAITEDHHRQTPHQARARLSIIASTNTILGRGAGDERSPPMNWLDRPEPLL